MRKRQAAHWRGQEDAIKSVRSAVFFGRSKNTHIKGVYPNTCLFFVQMWLCGLLFMKTKTYPHPFQCCFVNMSGRYSNKRDYFLSHLYSRVNSYYSPLTVLILILRFNFMHLLSDVTIQSRARVCVRVLQGFVFKTLITSQLQKRVTNTNRSY